MPEGNTRVTTAQSSALGVIALVLAILTALLVIGMLSAAAALYSTIERATSVSAGEGPSLTAAQEQVSHLVATLTSVAIPVGLLLGIITFPFAMAAVGLRKGRRFGVAALVILAAAALTSVALLLWAFPIEPCLGHITCHA